MARKDIHRWAVLEPEEYVCVGWTYLGEPRDPFFAMAVGDERRRFAEAMRENGWRFAPVEHGGTCYLCGASASYLYYWLHKPTNQVVASGADCAERLSLADDQFYFAQRKLERLRKLSEKRAAGASLLGEIGIDPQAAAEFLVSEPTGGREDTALRSILRAAFNCGSLTDKQRSYVKELWGRRDHLDQPVEKPKPKSPCPEGSGIGIVGEVVSVRERETPYGSQLKMVVRGDDGWAVWGTVPAALGGVAKGDRVRFVADVSRSENDSGFGFFRRPRRAEIILEKS